MSQPLSEQDLQEFEDALREGSWHTVSVGSWTERLLHHGPALVAAIKSLRETLDEVRDSVSDAHFLLKKALGDGADG